jgi:hypothetical protein
METVVSPGRSTMRRGVVWIIVALALLPACKREAPERIRVTPVGFYKLRVTPPFFSQTWVAGVAVSGPYAYVAAMRAGLRVVDVSDPSTPREVGFYEALTPAHDIAVSGSHAYVAALKAGLRVVDVSDPSTPREVGFYEAPASAYDVAVSGPYAYVAALKAGLRVVDVSDPASPREVGFYQIPDSIFSKVVVSGQYAYVITVTEGKKGEIEAVLILIIDVSNPHSPHKAGSYSSKSKKVYDMDVSGTYAYVTDPKRLRVIDVSNPSSPREVSTYKVGAPADVIVAGTYAYLTAEWRLRVLDVSNPASPREVGSWDLPRGGKVVAVSGTYVYVADREGLTILQVGP